jgi:hypothetical protein
MSELDDFDLVSELESEPKPELIAEALKRAHAAPEHVLLGVDPFDGDYTATNVLRNKMVAARKPYVDHWTGRAIEKGERHRCFCERDDDGIVTTRHSVLSLWIMHVGGDSSFLAQEPRP